MTRILKLLSVVLLNGWRLRIDAIAVVHHQIDERFVTAFGGVKVVMRFVEHHAWAIFFVSRVFDGRVELRIGRLLRHRGDTKNVRSRQRVLIMLITENPIGPVILCNCDLWIQN